MVFATLYELLFFFWISAFTNATLSSAGSSFRHRYKSLIDLNLDVSSSTVYLPTIGMHLSISPNAQFTGMLDLEFFALNFVKVEIATIWLDDSIVLEMNVCIELR